MTLSGQGEHNIRGLYGDFVNRYEVVGDSVGPDVGHKTSVSVHFNPVSVWTDTYKRDPYRTIFLKKDDGISLTPLHTGAGDQDFYGYGPQVSAAFSIYIHEEKKDEIWYTISMKALETAGDRTEAEGMRSDLLYKHDRPIKSINSSVNSTFSYTDTNTRDDTFVLGRDSLVNRYNFIGDTVGNDVGKTGVTVYLNPIEIEEID